MFLNIFELFLKNFIYYYNYVMCKPQNINENNYIHVNTDIEQVYNSCII